MESWVVCAFVLVFFCGLLVHMKFGSMLIFLACCGQQIPILLMAVHHLQVCVCVCVVMCELLCGCQGGVCVSCQSLCVLLVCGRECVHVSERTCYECVAKGRLSEGGI